MRRTTGMKRRLTIRSDSISAETPTRTWVLVAAVCISVSAPTWQGRSCAPSSASCSGRCRTSRPAVRCTCRETSCTPSAACLAHSDLVSKLLAVNCPLLASRSFSVCAVRDGDVKRRPASSRTGDAHAAAEHLDAVFEPDEPGALARVGPADPVVRDEQAEAFVGGVRPHLHLGGLSVLCGIG